MSDRPTKNAIREYQKEMAKALGDVDQALKVEALDDAEEFIEEMAGELLSSGAAKDRERALSRAIRTYGSPRTVANEYLRRSSDEERHPTERMDGPFAGILGVYVHKETYLGLLYLLLMLPFGATMFAYILLGMTLGVGLTITVVGIPILVLFLVSIYGISYALGRGTELLLGIRMPRKKRKMYLVGSNWKKLRTILKDLRLYSSIVFLLLLFPLGTFYFVVLVTLLMLSISFMALPLMLLMGWYMDLGNVFSSNGAFMLLTFLASVSGFVLLTWTLHLSNWMWYIHGKLVRTMLLKV